MAKYTTQIRSIVEAEHPIFDFDYPIFDESYRAVLEKKIIDHYYFREIGLETVGQFKHFLKSKMNTIMPYYNQLYDSEGLVTRDDYWENQNSVESHTRTTSQDITGVTDSVGNTTGKNTVVSDSTSDDTVTGKEVFSDTPQAKLQGLDYATNLTDRDGTTGNVSTGNSVVDNVEDSTGKLTNTGTADTFEEWTTKLTGGGGLRYNADILMEWRKSFLNIDQLIIRELNDLFMNIY
jgi:hypothetical protein